MIHHTLAALLTVIALALAPSASGRDRLEFDPDRPLTTLHGPEKQNSIDEIDSILNGLLTSDSAGEKLPLVVYVHGRGNEPRKSFEDTTFTKGFVLSKIESQGVRVLGFGWKSKIRFLRLCDRPVEDARSAATSLAELVDGIADHRARNPDSWKDRRVILLSHSMGAFVVAEAARLLKARNSDFFFDVAIVSAPDTPAEDHATWLDAIKSERVVVLSNPTDRFLRRSMSCEGRNAPIRLGLLSSSDTSIPRSSRALYLEIPAGDRHRYFTRGGQGRNPHICSTLRSLIRGEDADVPSRWRARTDAHVYRLPHADSASDPCFDGAEPVENASSED